MPSEPLHILLLDDEPRFTTIIGTAIARENCRITSINNSTQALEAIDQDPPDLAVLDIMMPGLSGYDICTAIRKRREDAYVLFATARTETADILKAFEAGANDYISKPFRIPEVQARIRAGLRVVRLQKDVRQKAALLEQALEENARIIGTAAHDVRSPLSIIINYMSLLGDEELMPMAKIKEVCLQRTYHIVNLVDDFLNLTRLNSGRVTCQMEDADFIPLVVSAILEYMPVAKKKNVTITYEIPDAPVEVMIDRERFRTVIINILSNAVKFTPAGGTIAVSLQAASYSATVHVRDSGIGIKPENICRIFEPFQRFQRVKGVENDTHTGMGMAITKRLVDFMGGSITVASEGDNKGTTFSVTVPLSQIRA